MDDEKIIELYWRRDETAIACTDEKYGRLCRKISDDILSSREDSEECVADTYLALWMHPAAAPVPLPRVYRRGDTQPQPEASAQPRRVEKRRSRSRAGGAGRNARLLRGGRARIRAPRAYEGDRRIPAHALGRRPEHFHLPLLALRADCGYCRAARLLAE